MFQMMITSKENSASSISQPIGKLIST